MTPQRWRWLDNICLVCYIPQAKHRYLAYLMCNHTNPIWELVVCRNEVSKVLSII